MLAAQALVRRTLFPRPLTRACLPLAAVPLRHCVHRCGTWGEWRVKVKGRCKVQRPPPRRPGLQWALANLGISSFYLL